MYQSYVAVHRKGDFVMPIDVEVKFDNGENVREHWDGQSRWTRFSYQKKAKVVSAEIDPDHTVQIDRDNFNNSFVVEPLQADQQAFHLLALRHPVGESGVGLVGCLAVSRSRRCGIAESRLQAAALFCDAVARSIGKGTSSTVILLSE